MKKKAKVLLSILINLCPIIALGMIQNPLGNSNNSLSKLFESITDVAIQLGTVVAGLAIMYAGYMYVTAAGNEEKVNSAQKTLTWAMIGTAILLGAKVIFTAIKGTITSIS